MNAILDWVLRWFDPEVPKQTAPPVIARRTSSPARKRGSRTVAPRRVQTPYWQENGWQFRGGVFQGQFQTRFGNWHGYGTKTASGRVEIYIHNPPTALHKHPQWHCFSPRPKGWFSVHPTTPIPDISAAILSIEKTIGESYAL
ncbi:MAG: hypothetical protein ABI042_18360 [Verrucomicrobiota bacterium]